MRRRGLAFGLVGLVLLLAPGGHVGAEARRWSVVPERSSITMHIQALGASQDGVFSSWTGDIRFDPARPEQASVAIDVRTASLRMRQAVVTRRAIGPGFLDADRYPSIGFRLQSLERLGSDRFAAVADVTIRGHTQPVVFPVDLRVEGRTAQMTGGFSFDRAAFDIGMRGPWNGLIGRQVRVEVSLTSRAP